VIVFGREVLGDWAKARIEGANWGPWYECIGQEIDGKIISVAVFTDYTGTNICIHLAGEKGWMTTEFFDAIFAYPFLQLKVNRLTAQIGAKRKKLIRFYRWFGFREEGLLREALKDDDMVIMGCLASDRKYGKKDRSTAAA